MMSGISFDPNGVSMDHSFKTNEFEQILNLLDKHKDEISDINIYNRFKEIFDKVKEQAHTYGHSEKREFAFLILHSMLHLFGYDHETEQEREEMEARQRSILDALGIIR